MQRKPTARVYFLLQALPTGPSTHQAAALSTAVAAHRTRQTAQKTQRPAAELPLQLIPAIGQLRPTQRSQQLPARQKPAGETQPERTPLPRSASRTRRWRRPACGTLPSCRPSFRGTFCQRSTPCRGRCGGAASGSRWRPSTPSTRTCCCSSAPDIPSHNGVDHMLS